MSDILIKDYTHFLYTDELAWVIRFDKPSLSLQCLYKT